MGSTTELKVALSGRYDIERAIGRGGMATVYLARDLKHSRRVALKVLDPEVGASIGTDRFLAEIRVTANLQHPNILPLFDSGEADGSLFYVMPFVAGESLRALIEREGQLAIDESIRIVTAIAHALDHAHRFGVVHRDIKPENILLSDGMPIVADFGIAKALADSQRGERSGKTAALTQLGVSLGTPAYMSPEQAMGEVDVDGRTDVYALGCLLYEMLAGALPFTGPTAHAIIAHHLMTPVPSVRSAREAVSPLIDAAIARAMAKEPASRFATPGALAAALVAVPELEPRPDYSRVAEAVTRTQAPIVGRRKELGELLARLDAMEQGRGGLVLIGGEPGVGKTRLTEAVLLEARRRGHFCAVGHCYEMEGAAPYQPFLEQIEFIARVVPPGRLRAVLGNGASEIARIMPALRQLFPDIGPPLDLPPDQQRQYLFSSVRDYLDRSAASIPCVLLFDDLHWADESSLLLLESLAPRFQQMRILALGTYRDVELEVSRPFAKSLERLSRQRFADRIILRRMPEADVADLLASLGAPDPPPQLVQAIYRETEGNPFFIEEVFHHLKEEGRLLDAEGHWLPTLHIDDLEVPEGVRLVIGRRLERVGDACRAVLVAAAVVGPRFDLKVLEALGEADADTILDALDRAEAAGLILAQAAGRETRYTFAHELIRQTLLGTLSMPRRQRRHQKTAEAIEKAYAGKLDTRVADLAYHLFQAGAAVETDRTLQYLLLAGRQALAAGAFDEADSHVERALSIIEKTGDRTHAEMLHIRGDALRGAGNWAAAVKALEESVSILQSLGEYDASVPIVLSLADVLSWAAADHAAMLDMVQRTIAALPNAPAQTRARLLARAGMATSYRNELYDPALAMINEALRLAQESGDARLVGEVLGLRGSLHHTFLCSAAATIDLGAAYQTAVETGAQWDAARWGSLYVFNLLVVGQLERADEINDGVGRTAAAVGHIGAAHLASNTAGSLEWLRTGNLEALEAFAQRAEATWLSPRMFKEFANSVVAYARLFRGVDPDPAAILEGSTDRTGHEAWRDRQWGDQFYVLAYTDPSRARQLFERYAHRLPKAGRSAFGGARLTLPRVIDGLAQIGDRALAASYYEPALEFVRDGAVVDTLQVFECALGIAAAAGERWETAEAHFVNALRTADILPHIPAGADVRRWFAWMLLSRRSPGDTERATQLITEALSTYERIGMVRHAKLCRDLSAQLSS